MDKNQYVHSFWWMKFFKGEATSGLNVEGGSRGSKRLKGWEGGEGHSKHQYHSNQNERTDVA